MDNVDEFDIEYVGNVNRFDTECVVVVVGFDTECGRRFFAQPSPSSNHRR